MSAPIPLRQDFAASQLGGLLRRTKTAPGLADFRHLQEL